MSSEVQDIQCRVVVVLIIGGNFVQKVCNIFIISPKSRKNSKHSERKGATVVSSISKDVRMMGFEVRVVPTALPTLFINVFSQALQRG